MAFTETGLVIASGTGFIYKRNDKFYLITNWHNVTGRNPITKECLDDKLATPDVIVTYFRSKENHAICNSEILKLYNIDDMSTPLWIEHPQHREAIDVVAIPINEDIVEKYSLFPINNIPLDNDIKPEISDEVFIIGYPFSDTPHLQLPIWKKGSIASEPTVNIDQLPKLYVDTATRPGLSGSPVIYQRTGIHNLAQGGFPKSDTIIGRIRGFLGIYSGRIGKDEEKAQLGIIWKSQVIDEIIDNNATS